MLNRLPNLLTISRILASLLTAVLLLLESDASRLAALLVFAAAGLTDWLDGWLARRLGAGSALGKMLDPIADKLLLVAAMLPLASSDNWDWVLLVPAICILMRELLVSGLREQLANSHGNGASLPVSLLAKWKTTIQLIALGGLILAPLAPAQLPLHTVAVVLFWFAAGITLKTGLDYLNQSIHHVSAK